MRCDLLGVFFCTEESFFPLGCPFGLPVERQWPLTVRSFECNKCQNMGGFIYVGVCEVVFLPAVVK